MATESANLERVFVVRAGTRVCILPVRNVVEVMRPLPTDPLPGMPSFLLGLAVIRGGPVPVIDLARLVGAQSSGLANRFVVLRLDGRRVAIAVEDVPGLREFGDSVLWSLAPLLEEANPAIVTAVSVSDQHLLFVLQAARIVPDELWHDLERATANP